MKSKKKIVLGALSAPIIALLTLQSASATYSSGGESSALRYTYYDSSVASYGYTSNYDSARNNWNNISSKVFVYSPLSTNASYADVYYVGYSSNPSIIGQTTPYADHNGTIASSSALWAYCTVTVYDNSMKGYGMQASQVVSNMTHEIGHSLSLAHPTIAVTSVMNQGVQSIGPSNYDKNELKNKWGN